VNRSLALFMATAMGLSALVAACSSSTPAQSSATNVTEPPGDDDPPTDGDGDDDGTPAEEDKDAGASPKDAGKTPKDAGGTPKDSSTPGPTAFTKQEVQALFNARCTSCHSGAGASAGMSLAADFTTKTVGVASTQLASMKRITAGDKEASYLFHKIRGTHLDVGGAGLRMPRSGPPYLSDSDVDRIGAFIDEL
jgi:mono/diheme cytochrome c family protein